MLTTSGVVGSRREMEERATAEEDTGVEAVGLGREWEVRWREGMDDDRRGGGGREGGRQMEHEVRHPRPSTPHFHSGLELLPRPLSPSRPPPSPPAARAPRRCPH